MADQNNTAGANTGFTLEDNVQLPASARIKGKRGSKFLPGNLMDTLAKANVGQGLTVPFMKNADGTEAVKPKRQAYATAWQINDVIAKENEALPEANRKKAEELPHYAAAIGEKGIVIVRDK